MSSISQPDTNELLAQYRKAVDDMFRWANIGQWRFNASDNTFEISADFSTHYGYEVSKWKKFPFEQWFSIVHPDDLPYLQASFVRLLQAEVEIWEHTYRLQDAAGQYRYFHSIGGVSHHTSDGQPIEVSGTIQDITPQKEAELRSRHREALLEAIAKAGSHLVNATQESFDESILCVLDIFGKAADVDRVYIWKNYTKNGRLMSSQIYEWSPNVPAMQGTGIVEDIAFGENTPTWNDVLSQGRCINNIVRLMPQAEQDILKPQGIISLLIVPIMIRDKFWGFIGFDDCRQERVWLDSEVQTLQSVSTMIASTINRNMVEEELAKEKALLDRIVNTSPSVMILSERGQLQRVNELGQQLFRWQAGQSVNTCFKSREKREEVWQVICEDGIYVDENYAMTVADGTEHYFIATMFALNIETRLAVAWFSDITDLKKTERQLTDARNSAQAATLAKGEFLARMSHEIRTPMNAILGIVYLCLQTELDDKQRDYLLKTQTAANNLLGIINDILDFSKIEAGKIDLEEIPFRLTDVLSEIKDVIEISAKAKGLKLLVDIAPDLIDNLIGDPLRLRQILINLMNNAVKFTQAGSITISAKPSREKTDLPEQYRLDFAVTDTGIGLSENQIHGIFDSFSQADISTTRKYGGTGLGLAIVKNLVELMGGSIDVSSTLGQGTTFHFTANFLKAAAELKESSAVLLSHRRVLVVDDDAESRDIVMQLTQSLGMRADSAASGVEALEKLTLATRCGHPYELVLMDWRMPRMDGIETIRQIHSRDGIITPPHIVMISAYDRQDCMHQTQGLNVAGILVKPINLRELKEMMKRAFRILRKSQESVPETRADIRGAKVLLAEDNKINQMVALELLKMHGVELQIVNNGIEAVEAVAANDFDLVLMDVQMPEMDGLTATQKIRQLDKPGIDRLPILAMTANAMDTDYQKSLDVGMNDHLTKPIDPEKLRLALEKWIQL
ncbi:MAG: response regulator [Planctomycetaceae bacterium]|jgi:signal transduction histidine kinase/CheY-like chemotaxis protein|nr:response regulator [Planctomycetaceae bacterium]